MEGCGYVSIYIKEEIPEDETPHQHGSCNGESVHVMDAPPGRPNDDNEMCLTSESEDEEPLCLESDKFIPMKEELQNPLNDGCNGKMYTTAEEQERTLHSQSDDLCISSKPFENANPQPNTSGQSDEWKLVEADWSEDSGKKEDRHSRGWLQELPKATSEDLCEQLGEKNHTHSSVKNCQRVSGINEFNSENNDSFISESKGEGHTCPECDKSFSYRSNLMIHMITHTNKKPLLSSNCEMALSCKSDITEHMRNHTSEKTKYKCPECNKVYANKSYFVFHMNSHILDKHSDSQESGDEPFFLYEMSSRISPKHHPCPECGKVFSRKAYLIAHLRSHTGERPFKCSECDKAYSCKSHLTAHIRTHTGERPYECSECGKSFIDKSFLISHMRIHTGEKPYQCTQCDKAFGNRNNLTHHIRTHTGEKPYHCSVCNKAFARNTNLTQHMRTHTGERPYPCPYCDMRFSWKPNLDKHMFLHSGEKPFVCDVCGKKCARKANLAIHMRVHTKEKPFKCPVCDKGFGYESVLTVHMRTHTGEKPYKCAECGKKFAHKSRLTDHMTKHSGEKPYSCLACNEEFARKSHLTKHMKKHHTEKPLPLAEGNLEPSSKLISSMGLYTRGMPLEDHGINSITHRGTKPGEAYKTIQEQHQDQNSLSEHWDEISDSSGRGSSFTSEGWCAEPNHSANPLKI